MKPGRWFRWLRLVLIFQLINVANGVEVYFGSLALGQSGTELSETILRSTSIWIAWLLVAPLVVRVTRRWPWERPTLRTVTIHLGALVVALVAHQALLKVVASLKFLLLAEYSPAEILEWLMAFDLKAHLTYTLRDLMVYPAIVAVTTFHDARQAMLDKALRAARLETQLARAQLQSLKSQLHPHFLFNALNACSTLMRTDVEAAERMLDLLADLLDSTHLDATVQEVTLGRELDFVNRYLDIERVRFSNRLRVELDIPKDLEGALVPHLILQPLVENAIRHGLSPKVGVGTLRLEARAEGDHLLLRVTDDGVGPGARRRNPGEGVGLANTRARLDQRYGAKATLDHGPNPGGGFQVRLSLPLAFEGGPQP